MQLVTDNKDQGCIVTDNIYGIYRDSVPSLRRRSTWDLFYTGSYHHDEDCSSSLPPGRRGKTLIALFYNVYNTAFVRFGDGDRPT